MGYSKLKDTIVTSKSDDGKWFLDMLSKKASPEAQERIKNGVRIDQEPSFFETSDGHKVAVYTDKDGNTTVFEEDLKTLSEDVNLAKFDTQLRECGLEKYSRVSFENIIAYKFLKNKFPRDLVPMFEERPIAYFYGGTGTGKTTLACAIGRDFARRGHSVVIRRWTNWLTQFREVYDDSSEMVITDHMKKAQNAYILILDEIGTDKKNNATEFEIEQLSRIVSDRYGNGKPMILTSNIDTDKLERIYGAQITSRITDTTKSIVQRFDGETDYRKNRRAALIQPALETF